MLQWADEAELSSVVNRLIGTPRSVFKTLAWGLSWRAWPALEEALDSGIRQPLQQMPDVTSSSADERPPVPRAMLPLLAGCVWCHDYCYDHVIEWMLQVR